MANNRYYIHPLAIKIPMAVLHVDATARQEPSGKTLVQDGRKDNTIVDITHANFDDVSGMLAELCRLAGSDVSAEVVLEVFRNNGGGQGRAAAAVVREMLGSLLAQEFVAPYAKWLARHGTDLYAALIATSAGWRQDNEFNLQTSGHAAITPIYDIVVESADRRMCNLSARAMRTDVISEKSYNVTAVATKDVLDCSNLLWQSSTTRVPTNAMAYIHSLVNLAGYEQGAVSDVLVALAKKAMQIANRAGSRPVESWESWKRIDGSGAAEDKYVQMVTSVVQQRLTGSPIADYPSTVVPICVAEELLDRAYVNTGLPVVGTGGLYTALELGCAFAQMLSPDCWNTERLAITNMPKKDRREGLNRLQMAADERIIGRDGRISSIANLPIADMSRYSPRMEERGNPTPEAQYRGQHMFGNIMAMTDSVMSVLLVIKLSDSVQVDFVVPYFPDSDRTNISQYWNGYFKRILTCIFDSVVAQEQFATGSAGVVMVTKRLLDALDMCQTLARLVSFAGVSAMRRNVYENCSVSIPAIMTIMKMM